MDKAVDNMEAIIFAAGSGPKTGPDKTTAVDKNGAIKLVNAAKKKGIERFVMLSSTVLIIRNKPKKKCVIISKQSMMHEHLKASGLTSTIVRPVALTNEQAIGKPLRMRKWIILISPFQEPMSLPFWPNLSQRKKRSIKHSRF
ncbi:NAD(P)H-binding protein [Bacillus sp. R1-10]